MSAQIIDGNAIAEKVRGQVKEQVAGLQARHGYTPGLATVLVGDSTASATYVRMKTKACAETGIRSLGHVLSAEITQPELETLIQQLNANPEVNGILVQLPLPTHLDAHRIIDMIALDKDVDGFNPMNIGLLTDRTRQPRFVACTPYGVMVLLEEVGTKLSGANAVVIGRSNIVGLPVAMLLQRANATVTICHSRTRDLAAHLKQADVVVAAVGQAEMVHGDMLKPGCVVIDVGINRVDDPSQKRGYRLVGDVHFESAKEVAGWITPVPGGVGPMTIAMLLKNTATAAARVVGEV